MPHPFPIALACCGALALAACSPTHMDQEAGSHVGLSSFGAATQANIAAQTGAADHALDLGRRFAGEVPNTVLFAFDSARLDDRARAILERQAHWIRKFPEVRFRVYGHTDLVGTAQYNQPLGQRRADAVVDYLVARGVSRGRLEGVVSRGETQPVIDTPAPEQRNRRAITEVSGFVESHPTLLDGRYAAVVAREYQASAERPLPPITDPPPRMGRQ